jgi:predicted unusual protein kinase regulating ubiquinone biosynthesis (AarF/ABC1/UbiB family)
VGENHRVIRGDRTYTPGLDGARARRRGSWRFYRISRLLFATLLVIARERLRVMRARAQGRYDVVADVEALRRALRNFRETAKELGGLLIKLGQFLSSRADLLPPEALAELAQLQDEIPAADFAGIRQVIEHELGAPVCDFFAAIDPIPTGSASLGQVHRARLHDGRIVAVKVQRPGIDALLASDLRALRFVIETYRRITPGADAVTDLRGLYREFCRTLFQELDYEREAYSIERFARLFAAERDVRVPEVHWSHTKRRVLTMEWIDGIKLSNLEGLDAAGIDRRALAKRILEVYFRQMLEAGFFHADPHPGNIFVQPCGAEGEGFRLTFVDFGMMGVITPAMKAGIRDWFLGIVDQDAKLVVMGLETVGFLGEGADRQVIEQAVALILSQFSALPLGQIRHLDLIEILGQIESLLYGQPLRLPANFAMLGRAMSMLVGLAMILSPTFSFLEAAKPYAQRFMQAGGVGTMLHLFGVEDMRQLRQILTREGIAMARGLAALPRIAERLLEHAEKGELRIVLEAPALTNPVRRAAVERNLAATVMRVISQSVPAWVPVAISAFFAILWWRGRRTE